MQLLDKERIPKSAFRFFVTPGRQAFKFNQIGIILPLTVVSDDPLEEFTIGVRCNTLLNVSGLIGDQRNAFPFSKVEAQSLQRLFDGLWKWAPPLLPYLFLCRTLAG